MVDSVTWQRRSEIKASVKDHTVADNRIGHFTLRVWNDTNDARIDSNRKDERGYAAQP